MHGQAMPSAAKHDYSSPNNDMRYQPMPRNGRRDHSMPSKTDQRQSRPMPSTINQCQARDIIANPRRARPINATHGQAMPSATNQHLAMPSTGHQWTITWVAGPPMESFLGLVHRRHSMEWMGLPAYFPWRKESQEGVAGADGSASGPPLERMARQWTFWCEEFSRGPPWCGMSTRAHAHTHTHRHTHTHTHTHTHRHHHHHYTPAHAQ